MVAAGNESRDHVYADEEGCHNEYEKLVLLANNVCKVVVDNITSPTETIVTVDGARNCRQLLKTIKRLSADGLTIKKAYLFASHESSFFMDVFHVSDNRLGGKLSDDDDRLHRFTFWNEHQNQQVLVGRKVKNATRKKMKTAIKVVGEDRPGILSEIFAVLAEFKCDVSNVRAGAHGGKFAALIFVADEPNIPIPQLLMIHLCRIQSSMVNIINIAPIDAEKQLHQIISTEEGSGQSPCLTPPAMVSLQKRADRGHSLVTVQCLDRPKLLHDIIGVLEERKYEVSHGFVSAEGNQAYQEFYIKDYSGKQICTEAEKEEVVKCLRDVAEGSRRENLINMEFSCQDFEGEKIAFLAKATRIMRENGLAVRRAEVEPVDDIFKEVSCVFQVTDSAGCKPSPGIIDFVTREIHGLRGGKAICSPKIAEIVKEKAMESSSNKKIKNSERKKATPRIGMACLGVGLACLGFFACKNVSNLGLIKSLTK